MRHRTSPTSREARLLALSIGVLPLSGCLAAAAVVTTAYAVELLSEQGYTLTVKAEAPPRELYRKLVETIKRRNPTLEIRQEDAKERRFSAKGADAQGVRVWVSFVVGPLPDESSQLLIAAGRDGQEGKVIRDWMLESIDSAFKEMGIEWKIAACGRSEPGALAASPTQAHPL